MKAKLVALLVLGFTAVLLWIGTRTDDGTRASPARNDRAADAVLDAEEIVGRAVEARREARVARDDPSKTADAPPRAGGLTARVVDRFEQPVAGADVTFAYEADWIDGALDVELTERDREDRHRATVHTDSEGRVRIDEVHAGVLRLLVRAPGYAPLATSVALGSADKTDIGDLTLDAGLILEGRVIDLDGVGVAGARLEREDESTQFFFGPRARFAPLTTTDSNGRFRADTLDPGVWTLRITSDNHPPASFEGEHYAVGISSGHVFQLERGWLISGRVEIPGLSDYSAYFVRATLSDKAEELADLPADQRVRKADCTADGHFELTNLSAIDTSTTYSLRALRLSGSYGLPVGEARAGQRDVVLAAEALAAMRFKLRGDDGPLGDPTVLLALSDYSGHINLTERGSVHEIAPDTFRVADITGASKSESFWLRVEVPGYRNYVRGQLQLAPGEERDLGVFELQSATMLEVHVLDALTGLSIAGAEVRRESDDVPNARRDAKTGEGAHYEVGAAHMKTDDDGIARLSLATGYPNYVFVSHPDYATSFDGPISVDTNGYSSPLEVSLERGATVRIRTEDQSENPTRGSWITTTSLGWVEALGPAVRHVWNAHGGGQTDATGSLILEHLQPGRTEFALQNETATGEVRFLELQHDSEYELVFVVTSRTALDVVVREAGVPLVDASVGLYVAHATDDDGEPLPIWRRHPVAENDTGGSGRARFENVEIGEYDLTVEHPTRSLIATRAVQVRLDGAPIAIELTVSGVSGRVLSADGTPCADALVCALSDHVDEDATLRWILQRARTDDDSYTDNRGGTTRTDAEGRFELRGLPSAATLQIATIPAGCQFTSTASFSLEADEQRVLPDLSAATAGTLELVTGIPGLHACLELQNPAGAPIRERRERFDRDGGARIDNLTPGNWRVRLTRSWSGFGEYVFGYDEIVAIRAGQTTRLELELPQ